MSSSRFIPAPSAEALARRLPFVMGLVGLAAVSVAGCVASVASVGDDDAGTGAAGSGGRSAATGGASVTGGATGSGGRPGTGGGVASTGGATGSGGGNATGGAGGSGTGGAGGRAASGGVPGSGGGNAGRGGAANSGGRGGATGGGGAMGTGGGGGTSAARPPCTFASGLNVAWVNFANDVPNPNMTAFRTLFQNTFAAGGRVVRWWLHTNGTVTPGYDGSGRANPLSQAAIDGVKSILAAANTAGVSIVISLWSFDMLQGGQNISSGLRTNNQNLLTVDANRQAYIDNVLIPLVNALKGNPGLYAYEIFNEPEGMTNQNGWTAANGGTQVDQMYIQKTVNWFAGAIHTADPTARVTNAAWTFKACSTVSGMTNYYSDTALRNVGGRANGTLDFYQVHYYALNGAQFSPFLNAASHWGLDKKVVMGEFYARATDGVSTNDLYTSLYTRGYSGAWAWQYNDGDGAIKWPTMQVPMQNVYNAHSAEVGGCR